MKSDTKFTKKNPGILATSLLKSFLRYESNKSPIDNVEKNVFKKLSKLSTKSKDLVNKSIDHLVTSESSKLKKSGTITSLKNSNPISKSTFEKAFISELKSTISGLALDNSLPRLEERPGKVRLVKFIGDDVYPNQIYIFKVGKIRTNDFRPYLDYGDYLPEEIQQTCTLIEENGKSEWDCKNSTEPCSGHSINGVCLTVPTYQAGTSIKLTGANYFNINAKVELKKKGSNSQPVSIEAFVYGDITTPKYGKKNGKRVLINDSRVNDLIFFTIPPTLATGIYEMAVVVPNNSNFQGPGISDIMYSNIQYIEVLPGNSTKYKISGEHIYARDETGYTNIGSDEIGLKFISFPIFSDLTLGAVKTKKYRFGDFDTGETRNIQDVLFSHTKSIAGIIMSVIGHEIDGENAYTEEINNWTDIFVDLVAEQWKYITGSVAIMAAIKQLAGLGFAGYLAIAVGILIVAAIDFIVSFWSTPDLIIEDVISLSIVDLGRLTSVNHPAPVANSSTIYTTPGNIKVSINLAEKSPNQYIEERSYKSEEEKSWYNIRLRYNRI